MTTELKAVYHETLSPAAVPVRINPDNTVIAGAHVGRGQAQRAKLTVEVASIYYLLNGSSPASGSPGTGHLLDPGDVLEIEGYSDIKNFMCVDKTGSGGAKVKVTTFFIP